MRDLTLSEQGLPFSDFRLQDWKTPAGAGWASCGGGKQSEIDGLTEPNTAVDRAVNLVIHSPPICWITCALEPWPKKWHSHQIHLSIMQISKTAPWQILFCWTLDEILQKNLAEKKILASSFHVAQRQWDASFNQENKTNDLFSHDT